MMFTLSAGINCFLPVKSKLSASLKIYDSGVDTLGSSRHVPIHKFDKYFYINQCSTFLLEYACMFHMIKSIMYII
jgi:hypothetical protein